MIDLVNDKGKRCKVIGAAFVIALICFAIAYSGHVEEWLERPFMILLFGFVGCWILIILAKIIMTPLLQRDEDYYQKGDDDKDV